MKIFRLGFLVPVLVLLIGVLSGCSGNGGKTSEEGADTAPIKIVFINALSGDSGTQGLAGKRSFEMFFEKINAAGGINGRKIEVSYQDDTSDPKMSVAAGQKAADQKDVMLICGTCSSTCTLALIPIITKAELPIIAYCSSSPSLNGSSPFFFRTASQDDDIGRNMVRYAVTVKGFKRVAGMYANFDATRLMDEAFIKEAIAKGATVTGNYSYLLNDRDFSAILTKIKAENPEAILLGSSYTDAALIIKQARAMGITAPFVGGGSLSSPKLIEIAGAAAEGLVMMASFSTTDPKPETQEFVREFQERYGIEPDYLAAQGYTTAQVIADACKRAMDANNNQLTRVGLKDALKATNLKALTGTVTFNDQGNWVRPYQFHMLKNGKWQLLQ